MTKELNAKRKAIEINRLTRVLEKELSDRYGPMLGGTNLSTALGYKSQAAFRQAAVRNTVPVPVFAIPRRKGKFALSREVARWMAEQRQNARATTGEELVVHKLQEEMPMTR